MRRTPLKSGALTLAVSTTLAAACGASAVEQPFIADTEQLSRSRRTTIPIADTYIDAAFPRKTFGGADTLGVDASPSTKRALLRFKVRDVPAGAKVTAASLKLYVRNAATTPGTVHRVAGPWSEATTWTSAPPIGSRIGDLSGPAEVGAWITADVGDVVTGNGTFDFYVTSDGRDGTDFSSREAAADPPKLVVLFDDGTATAPTPTTNDAACTVRVAGDLAQALKAAPEGATLCLSGTYKTSVSLVPRRGQTLIGPAAVIGVGVLDVFALKTGPDGVHDVTFRELDISGAQRHGIGCWLGTTVVGGRLHHNGKDGLGCDLEGQGPVVVDGTEIDHNGSDEWLGKGAAGIKWFHSHRVTVKNSHIHDNHGNGVWCDAQCGDFTVTANLIEANFRKGVFYEKGGESDMRGAFYQGTLTVTGNTIRNNNQEHIPAAHGGVSVYASKNAVVRDNAFGGNGRAVIVRNDTARLNDDKHGWIVENVTVDANLLDGDTLVGCDVAGVACTGNVR